MRPLYWPLALATALFFTSACSFKKAQTTTPSNSTPIGKIEPGVVTVTPQTEAPPPADTVVVGWIEEPEKTSETRVSFDKNMDLDAALLRAQAENKPVFIDFYTTWCMPCRMMDESVFRDWDVADFMNESVVALKVNAEQGNGILLKKKFNVNAYPTMVFLNAKGQEISRKEGTLSISEFKTMMKAAAFKAKQ